MTTVMDIVQGVRQTGAAGRVNRYSKSIAEGLTPKPLPKLREGIHHLTPEQTLSLQLPLLEVDGDISGYQRDAAKAGAHVRKIAQAINDGVLMPSATVAEFEGCYYLTDGGHRALAHIQTRTPFRIEVRKLNPAQQRELFHNQARSKRLSAANSILTGDGPVDLYVQDQVTAPETPWAGLIALVARDRFISPAALGMICGMYGTGKQWTRISRDIGQGVEFDPKAADELAGLLRAFGTPRTNPMAFDAMTIRAITGAAVLILRGDQRRPGDVDRWMRHMPKFNFADHRHLRKQTLVRAALLAHWNKRLPADRKIEEAG